MLRPGWDIRASTWMDRPRPGDGVESMRAKSHLEIVFARKLHLMPVVPPLTSLGTGLVHHLAVAGREPA
jgi:hypothetical protein